MVGKNFSHFERSSSNWAASVWRSIDEFKHELDGRRRDEEGGKYM